MGGSAQLLVTAARSLMVRELLAATAAVGLCLLIFGWTARIAPKAGEAATVEPRGRRCLRFGLASLWILDSILSLQASIPGSVPGSVLDPSAVGSPSWVVSLVDAGGRLWGDHPTEAAAAVTFIELGLGLGLFLSRRTFALSVASALWATAIWIFGEAFGGLLNGTSVLTTGAPGGALVMAVASLLLLAPQSRWSERRTITIGLGMSFLTLGVLQAWPGRGSWDAKGSPTAQAAHDAASMHQPALFHGIVSSFASFDTGHGATGNAVIVVILVMTGTLLVTPNRLANRVGLFAGGFVALSIWFLVEDLGFLGGTGTNPGTMIPIVLLVAVGFVDARSPVEAPPPSNPTIRTRLRSLVVAGSVMAVGIVPMAVSAMGAADPITAEATDGAPTTVNSPAPTFSLIDQSGTPTSLQSLRGKFLVVTFLDPVCTSDCPLIARSMAVADADLGTDATKVEMVAIDANPDYTSLGALRSFDHEEHLTTLSNWRYLTGPTAALHKVWTAYGVLATAVPNGAMIDHSEVAFLINASGEELGVIGTRPGVGSSATSSYASLLGNSIRADLGG